MAENIMLDAALAFLEKDFRVFPLNGKLPVTLHGFKDATQTQAGVREFWTKYPNANIGICTQNFVVLDFDVKSGGAESKIKLEVEYGELPKTRVHRTGSGGQHWIYSNPTGQDVRNTTKFAGYPGVDIRANGGYICVPPSIHPDTKRRYEVLDDSPIVPCPDWILDALYRKPSQSLPATGEEIVLADGERNATMTSLAGAMRRKGMGYEAILAALKATKCQNPLLDKEIETIAKSSMRWNPDPLESLPITEQTEQLDVSTEQTGIRLNKLNNSEQKGMITELTEQKTEQTTEQKRDRIIWPILDQWLDVHRGERFDLDTICRQNDISGRESRQSVAKKLSYEVGRGKLEKDTSSSRARATYLFINNTINTIDWVNAPDVSYIDLSWPHSHTDNSEFSFTNYIKIPAKGIIVVAGVSNTGKTSWVMNFLAENWDKHLCTLMGNEYEASDFKDRLIAMTGWANPLREDGTPKFELLERHDSWKDIIRPDNINIIDWINLDGILQPFYAFSVIAEGIKQKLNKGICVICIQKDAFKELGRGGSFTLDLASLYLSMDFGRITIKKAKKWHNINVNNHVYGFDLENKGTNFRNIRKIKICPTCHGTGEKSKYQGGGQCDICIGTKYVDDLPNTQGQPRWDEKYRD